MPEVDIDDGLNSCAAAIFSCSGPVLTTEETVLFAKSNPFGFVLFGRNVENLDQMRNLTRDLRQAVGRADVPILMDQEGGRVQRLRPPNWRDTPSQARLGALYDTDPEKALEAVELNARLMAADLHDIGINVNCAPCLDLQLPATSSVIGDRAFSADPERVALLGRLVATTLLEEGIMPVFKHIPGHGRALVDSHFELPVVRESRTVLARTDFAPFKALSSLPWAMTAHIIFSAYDDEFPATQSVVMINDVIRGQLNFDGLLLSDDINMEALSGSVGERAESSLAAGCDIALHCSGELTEMKDVIDHIGPLSAKAVDRIRAGRRWLGPVNPSPDTEDMKQRFAILLDA